MKALLFGTNGQVGREILRRAGAVLIEPRGRAEADFTKPETCTTWIAQTDADIVINAAAFTNVDKAEEQEALALQINAQTPGALARAAAARGLPFIHISTDYVFDGQGERPYAPDHLPNPLGAYGRSKLAGEEAVRAAGGTHAILRSSWVISSHGHNFVKTMLRLGAERDRLAIVADQIGGPTPAAALSDACLAAGRGLLKDARKSGTYHVSGQPDLSWAEFAREIFAQAGFNTKVTDIPSSDYPSPAKRPLNARLDNRSFEATFGLSRPNWRDGLSDILTDLQAQQTSGNHPQARATRM